MQRYALVGIFVAVAAVAGLANPLSGLGLADGGAVSLAIVIVAAGLWITEALPLFVTSFVVLLLSSSWLVPQLEAEGVATSSGDYLAPFSSNLVMLFLGGFVLAAGWQKVGLDEWLANRVIRRAKGDLPTLVALMMAVTAFLSMWLSNTAATALVLGLCAPVTALVPERVGGPRLLLLAVPLAANLGGLGTPVGTPPNAIVLGALAEAGHPIDFATWMAIGLPAVLVLLAFVWGMLLTFFGGRGVVLDTDDLPVPEAPLETMAGRGVLLVSAVTIAAWLFGSPLGIKSGTAALIPVIGFFGSGLLRLADFRNLAWDVLFLMGGGLCLAVGMQQSGLAAWLVAGIPVDVLSSWAVAAAFLLVAVAMSTVMSNTATASLLAPLVLGLSSLETTPVFLSVAFGCSLAMALPISTPPNAMAFASGQLEARDLLRVGSLVSIVGSGLTVTVFVAWWAVVLG